MATPNIFKTAADICSKIYHTITDPTVVEDILKPPKPSKGALSNQYISNHQPDQTHKDLNKLLSGKYQ